MKPSAASSALIFKVNQLGDNVVFLPVVQQLLRGAFAGTLHLWTTPLAAPLYSFSAPGLAVTAIARDRFFGAWRRPPVLLPLVNAARRTRATALLVPEDMGNSAYLLARLAGIPTRIGADPSFSRLPTAINRRVAVPPDLPAPEKAWRLGAALAAALGSNPWPAAPPSPDLSHLIDQSAPAYDLLIHPGASRAYQRWPANRFAEVAVELSRSLRVGWIAAPEVPELPPAPVDILRPASLAELVSLLARATVYLGNNSGPMHLASALGVPSVIPVGSSAYSWDPYWHRDRFRLLRDTTLPCIACDPPGQPIREVCTNRLHPMACLEVWSTSAITAHVRALHDEWAAGRSAPPAGSPS